MSTQKFTLPDPGEGLPDAEIATWKVQVGDSVTVNDVVVEIETAKSLVELPIPWSGTVRELLVAEGDTVDVGTPIIVVDVNDGVATPQDAPVSVPEAAPVPAPAPTADPEGAVAATLEAGSGPNLVGYGATTAATQRRPRTAMPPTAGEVWNGMHHESAIYGQSRSKGARRETRTPVKGVRKATAQAMVASAFSAPHVTEFVTVDASATMELVDRLAQDREFADIRVTPLLLIARALCIAVRRNPGMNAVWDQAAGEIITKHYVNLGIAAATPRGLIVPNIKDADQLSLHELGSALGEIIDTARAGRTQPADQAGGTITITNVGVFGIDSGTPIINPGESAIVCLGAVRRMPWVTVNAAGREQIEPRWVTTIGCSFDHRLIDGELGSKFLADLAALVQDPTRAFTWA